MSEKKHPDQKQNKEQVYFVEDVTGTDFTFYLRVEGNEILLSKEAVSHEEQYQAGQGEQKQLSRDAPKQPGQKKFSYSTKLNLVQIPLDQRFLKDEGDFLFTKLKEASKQSPQSTPTSEDFWAVLFNKFSTGLRRKIKLNGRKEDLLEKILEELNGWLTGKGGEKILEEHAFQQAVHSVSGRALICRTYQGKLLSVSFREKHTESDYKPDERVSEKYPLSIEDYCNELYNAIFNFEPGGAAKRGLLVIAGATNSSKSEIATGLIYKYLEERKQKDNRQPHLVTFEDPIEKFYARAGFRAASNLSVKMPSAKKGIDYTPREKGNADENDKDAESLKDALEDALRQTPTVLFVGETRDKADWRRLIDFASTGHLIVTTAHAGSLTEAMHKIFEALSVKTPAERSEIANRLLGIVHIKRYTDTNISPPQVVKNILIPALWRRTQTGKNALTAEGLSSLLPYKPEREDDVLGCLGRAWFAEKLTGETEGDLIKKAIEWDLEGI